MGSDGRRRHRSREDRRRESSRRHEEEERESGADELTEEERRLYDKARAFVEQEDNKGRQRSRSDRHRSDSSEEDDRRRNKGRKKKSRDKYNSSDDDDHDDDSRKRHHRSSSHRDRKKHHNKRSSRDRNDRHEKSRQKKKSKHRHNHDDDEDKKHNKHHRSNKRHKHHHHDDSSFRRKATKHNNITLSKLVSLGEMASEPPQELLDTDTNYFSHNSHLRLYLFRRYGIYFEDLTSEESHDAFQEFVSKYNEGKLEAAYYNDTKGKLPQEALDQCQRTQHKWNFKTNKVEEQSLKIVRDGVKKQTEYDADNNDNRGMMQRTQATTVTTAAAAVGPKPADQSDEITNTISYDERRRLDKQHRERIKVGNEEMYGTGKADHGSRERMIEKRREQSNKIHGAARDREGGEAGLELDDKAIYGGEGGGDVSYEAALAREKKYRERKEAAKLERTSELLKKEEEKQKQMLEMLGLKPGEKIKIAPRQP